MKVKVFVIEYQEGTVRRTHHESLTFLLAQALGRELARRGRKPIVRRLDLTPQQIRRFEVKRKLL